MTRARTRTAARGGVSPGTLKYRAAKDVTKRFARSIKGTRGTGSLLDGSRHKATALVAWPLVKAMNEATGTSGSVDVSTARVAGQPCRVRRTRLAGPNGTARREGDGRGPHGEISESILPKGAQTVVPSRLDSRVGGFWIGGCKACGACIRRSARSRRYHGGVAT